MVEAILNSSEPISGTTVRSSPTMPPTKALIRTSSENCCQFSRKPERDAGVRSNRRIGAGAVHSAAAAITAGIDGADFRRLRGRRRNIGEHGAHELAFVVDPKRLVVALLEADGRDRLAAQAASAHRTRIGAGQDLQIIRQRFQALHAAEQGARAVFGARCKLGAAEIADHQRVAGEHEPRLVGAGAIGDEERNMLRSVSGRVQHLDGHVAESEHVAVAHTVEREMGGGFGEQHVFGARRPQRAHGRRRRGRREDACR